MTSPAEPIAITRGEAYNVHYYIKKDPMKIGAFELIEPLPELREPHALAMLRPWIDVGSVGTLALSRLESHLQAQELGKLAKPGMFFDFTRYRPTLTSRDGKREVTVPNSFVRYARQASGPDFVFLHLLEPHMFGEDYTDSVVELFKALGIKRYFLAGAMYDAVPHTRPLLVTGSISGVSIQHILGASKVEQSTYEGPTTINYLVGQKASALGIENSSLIAHLPQYAQLDEDFSGAARVLEIIAAIYALPKSIIDYKRGEEQYRELSLAVASNPRLKPMIKQLEQTYDARAQAQPGPPQTKLSAELEGFLREMGEKLDGGGSEPKT